MKPFRMSLGCLLVLVPMLLHGQTLRFAWLTDTHVGNQTGADDLRASVQDINSLDSLDFVVLSGDITEYGSTAQLRQAKAILDQLTIPYHIIPGNHDTKWSESGATSFPRIWGSDRFVFEAGPYRFIGLHEGPIMRMGDGQFSPEDLRWLDSTLTAMPDLRQPVIFVTHYPLDDGIANWHEAVERLRQSNTQLVLVGHGHRNRTASFAGIPGVMSRSNLRARDSLGAYTIAVVEDHTISFSEREPGGPTAPSWHRLELNLPTQESPSLARPDFSVNDEYPKIRKRWTRSTGYTITASPEQTTEVMIVGDASGRVYGLDLDDGTPRWEFATAGPVRSAAAVHNNLAVFGSTDGMIYCINASDGTPRWTYATRAPVVACPVIIEGVVYSGASDGTFRALSLDSGSLLWQYEGIAGFVEAKPVVDDGTVMFGAWDGNFYGLDGATGKLRWKWQGDRSGVLYSPGACWPVTADGRVFIAAPDRMVTCIEIRTGRQLWRTGMVQARETIGISDDRRLVFVRTLQDSIVAFRSDSDQPELAWVADVGFGYDINSAMIRTSGDTLFYGTKNGLVIALNCQTGELIWKHRVSAGMIQSPLPLDNGAVAITAYDGTVTVLDP